MFYKAGELGTDIIQLTYNMTKRKVLSASNKNALKIKITRLK